MITTICFIGLIVLFEILKGKEEAQWWRKLVIQT